MFLSTLFAKSQPYTDRFSAERALALYISENNMFMQKDESIWNQFLQCMMREQYGAALGVWNQYTKIAFNGNTLYLATVTECEVDRPFT